MLMLMRRVLTMILLDSNCDAVFFDFSTVGRSLSFNYWLILIMRCSICLVVRRLVIYL